jgi:hypothetical protein
MSDEKKQVGRLAFRKEGEWVNAYWAMPDTMEGAIHLGSMKVGMLDKDPALFEMYRELIRIGASKLLDMPAADWITEAAPEHERSGSA